MAIKIEISGILIIMTKFFAEADKVATLDLVPDGARRVLFVDTPATEHLHATIVALQGRGIKVVIRDHHDVAGEPANDREIAIHLAADAIRERVRGEGDGDCVISTRSEHPACSTLIEAGEFVGVVDCIIADPDPDGLLGAMKALGVVYPELDADAAVLDGGRVGQTRENLSKLGFKLVQGMAALPPYNPKNPRASEEAKAELFTQFVLASQEDFQALQWLDGKVQAYEELISKTKEVISEVEEILPGVQFVDISGKGKIHLQTLAAHMERQPGCRVTVVCKDVGPICSVGRWDRQYSLSVPRKFQQEVNLQDLLPEGFVSGPKVGVISNTSFLLHVSREVWEEIILPSLKKMFGGEEKK